MFISELKRQTKNSLFFIFFIISLLSSEIINGQTASFSFTLNNNCAPVIATFHNTSTQGGGLKYLWDLGKGVAFLSEDTYLTESYSSAGTYNIILKVIDGSDTTTTSEELIIREGPKANFSVSDTSGCYPLSIDFSNTSTPGEGTITSGFWDFRTGDTKTGLSTNYVFEYPGLNSVYFRISDSYGCSDDIEKKDFIRSYDHPKASFFSSGEFSCTPPYHVEFTNTSRGKGTLASEWDFGNGETSLFYNTSTNYFNNGDYNVSLTVTDKNACSDHIVKNSNITIGIGNMDILYNQDFNILHKDSLYLCVRDYHVPTSTGDSIITVCSHNDSLNYYDSILICPEQFLLQNSTGTSEGVKWIVNNNGNIVTHNNIATVLVTPTKGGKIEARLIYGIGTPCTDTIIKTYFVDTMAVDFEFTNGPLCMQPLDVTLTDRSYAAVSYEWRMPDRTMLYNMNENYTIKRDTSFKHKYTHNEYIVSYPFKHAITTAIGCRESITKNLVFEMPTARFMPDTLRGCSPLEVNFSDSSKDVQEIVAWTYLLDDTEISSGTQKDIAHQFTSPGDYEVKLVIENDSHCVDTSYPVTIRVGSKLNPDFSTVPDNICYGSEINFNAVSADNVHVDQWQFHSDSLFNKSSDSTGNLTTFLYPHRTGSFDVSLRLDYNGCVSDTTKTIEITSLADSGKFYFDFNCETPYYYTFWTDFDTTMNFTWTVNGVTESTTDSLKINFPVSDDYEVVLVAENIISGCTVTKRKVIKVRNIFADYTPVPHGCQFTTVLFNSANSVDYIDNCYQEGFLWNFGDSTPPRRTFDILYDHIYSDTGTFQVKLYATAANGCIDSVENSITIHPLPEPIIAANRDVLCGSDQSLVLNYINDNSDIVDRTWYLGDGNLIQDSLIASPLPYTYHTTESDTVYPALNVTDKYGCQGLSDSLPIKIIHQDMDFYALDNTLCPGQQASIIIKDIVLDSFKINYGDGNITESLTHDYHSHGLYGVSVTGYRLGCPLSRYKPAYIDVDTIVNVIGVSDSIFDCYPETVNFTHISPSPIAFGVWDFGDGAQSGGYTSPADHTYTLPGAFLASLDFTTTNGCTGNAEQNITLNGPTANYNVHPTTVCPGKPVYFNAENLNDVDSLVWTFGDGTSSTTANTSHIYSNRGPFIPILSLKSGECIARPPVDTVYPSQLNAQFEFWEDSLFCSDDSTFALNNTIHFNSSVWKVDNDQVYDDLNFKHIISAEGAHELSLIAGDQQGCSDTLTRSFWISAVPDFTIQGDSMACANVQYSLFVDKEDESWQILWQSVDAIANNTSFNITQASNATTMFQATVTNTNGCSGSKTKIVNIDYPATLSQQPAGDTSIFIGQKIPLIISSSDNDVEYNWSPNTRISCTNCNSPEVSPHENITYTVEVTDNCATQSRTFYIEVIADFYLEFPSAFTPNDDGNNDIFVYEHRSISEVDFRIYNRWGNLVFKSASLGDGWDGTVNDKYQTSDSYTYFVRAKTIGGFEFEKKGTFMLMR